MILKSLKLSFSIILFLLFFVNILRSEEIKKIEFFGNDRVPNETILMLSKIDIGDILDEETTNQVLVNLYNSNFFKNVNVQLNNNILKITVTENPLIEKMNLKVLKLKELKKI